MNIKEKIFLCDESGRSLIVTINLKEKIATFEFLDGTKKTLQNNLAKNILAPALIADKLWDFQLNTFRLKKNDGLNYFEITFGNGMFLSTKDLHELHCLLTTGEI